MLCPYIRSSSYGAYDYCALKYYFNYNLGWSEPPNLRAQLGTIVHKVMEVLACCKQTIQQNKPLLINDEHIGEISFTKKSLSTKKFVSSVLDRSFDHYSKSDKTNNYTKKEYDTCEEWVWMAIEYNKGQFDPRNRVIVAPEQEFDIPIMEDWAIMENDGRLAIKGTVDLITEVDCNTLEVVDYKTGQRKNWATGKIKTYDDLQNDTQLLLYYYAISKIFPQYEYIIMTIFFIRDGGPFSMCFDDSDKTKFLKKLENRYKEIINDISPKPIDKYRNDFRCKRLCHFYKTEWGNSGKSMCQYVEDNIKVYGIEATTRSCKNSAFSIDKYKAPGASE